MIQALLDASLGILQAEEIASLRKKLEEFSDYDEVKRELDIMKVRTPFDLEQHLTFSLSSLNFRAPA
jgi:hypothetical protein